MPSQSRKPTPHWGSDGSPEVERILLEGLAHERAGRWTDAYLLAGELLTIATRRSNAMLAVYALYIAARALHRDGRHPAVEIAELALEITRACGIPRAEARVLNLLGSIIYKEEDWRTAQRHYEAALELAQEERDDELIAAIFQNLGVVATALGNLREARTLYMEGICACVRSDNLLTTATIYNNLAMVSADLEEWMEAEIHFMRGIEIAERLGDKLLLALLSAHRAEPLIHTGDFAAARASLIRAEEVVRDIEGRHRVLADISRYEGMMARLQGEYADAEAHLEHALALTDEGDLALERAETLEEMSRLRAAEGRLGAARIVLLEARRIYEDLGAHRDLNRVDALAREQRATQTEEARHPAAPEMARRPVAAGLPGR